LASEAIRIDIPSMGGKIAPSSLRRGGPFQKSSSLTASSANTTQQLSDHIELIKA
jgi:hypothetical protein